MYMRRISYRPHAECGGSFLLSGRSANLGIPGGIAFKLEILYKPSYGQLSVHVEES